jgi:putative resolvase
LSTGTLIVKTAALTSHTKMVLYARVSSHDQKTDLERQLPRLRDYASVQGWVIAKEITEIGSGLNGKRKKLLILKVLQDEIILKPEFWWNTEIA